MTTISSEVDLQMEDLIDAACAQALKKLTGTLEERVKDVNKKDICSVGVVEQDIYKKVPCATDQADYDEGVEEEEVDSEGEPEVDPKLLLYPTVYTTKLDNMGLFDHNSFNYVDRKELIDLAYIKSNPLRKNIATSEKNMNVESIVIDTSDEDNKCNDADNNDDDDIQLIGNNICEAERVLSSNIFLKNSQIHKYNHLELLKNPDFEKTLKELNIDINALVDCGVVMESYEENNENSVHHKQDINDHIQPSTTKDTSAVFISGASDHKSMTSDTLVASARTLHGDSKNIAVNSERIRAVKLPNITDVRLLNQKLLTAEVPPVQTQNGFIQPSISRFTSFSKAAPYTSTTLTDQSMMVNNRSEPPPLIMFPQPPVSVTNTRANNIPNHDVTYTVSKQNVQISSTISNNFVIVSEFDKTQNIQCTGTAKQLVKTVNGNVIVRTTKCRRHDNLKTVNNINQNQPPIVNNSLTGQNLSVTSAGTPQNATEKPQNVILPADVQLLVLPTGEMVYVVGQNVGLNTLSGGAAVEPNSKIPGTNVQNRFIFSVDANASQSNSVTNRHNEVKQKLKTTPPENSKKVTIKKSIFPNEKRLFISLVDSLPSQLESDNQKELNASQLETNSAINQNERRFSTIVVNKKSSECAATPNKNMDQPVITHATVRGGTVNNVRIRTVNAIKKPQEANKNNRFFHKLKFATGPVTPYPLTPTMVDTEIPMTIDLTDDGEKPAENAVVPISLNKDVVKETAEKTTEQKSLQNNPNSKSLLIDNQPKVPEISKSILAKSGVEQNQSLNNEVAKQYFKVKVQGQPNKINNKINETKGTASLVELNHAQLASNSKIQTRKRNSEPTKPSNEQPLPKMSLLIPLDTKGKTRPKSMILEGNDHEFDMSTESKSTSGWVLLGL